MKRVYVGIFGSGLGHTSRMYSIVTAMKSSNEVQFQFSTFDEGFDFLKKRGEPVVRSPSMDVHWDVAGGFSGRGTLVRFPAYLFTFSKQVAFERSGIEQFNPRVVVSDSRLSTVFAAKYSQCPVVTILNQFKVLFPPRFRVNKLSRLYERIEGDVLGLFWSLSNELLFPDLPPPFTLGEANIAGTDVANKVKFTGFMNPKKNIIQEKLRSVRDNLGFDSRPVVFVQISGPEATKQHFVDAVLRAADSLSTIFNLVISLGQPFGSTIPRKLKSGGWLYEWCPLKDELFLLSDVLVVRAGHATLGQCVEQAKPAVVVPIYNHSEQIWNAEKFVKLGLGIEIKSEYLTPELLVDAVTRCYREHEFSRRAETMKRLSDKYDGVLNAIEIVRKFL